MLSYCDELSQSILTDGLVGLLHSKGVITKDTQKMIREYNVLGGKPFRTVCVTVADDHQKLKVLADVLLQSTETALLGRELADKYCESIIIIFCLGTGVPRLCAGFGTSSSSSSSSLSSSSASLAYS